MADLIAARSFAPLHETRGTITPAALCAAVQRRIDAADNPILISDGGEFGQWAQACLSAPRRLINGPSGAIGGGLCYAIAAKKAYPDAAVFVLMGDGSVGFHLAELETAVRENALPPGDRQRPMLERRASDPASPLRPGPTDRLRPQ